jgi:hypothetical protein
MKDPLLQAFGFCLFVYVLGLIAALIAYKGMKET